MRMMVNNDHTGYNTTRRSCTGFMIFLNTALVKWISKKQPTVESAVFGAKFVAMMHGVEKLQGICYKISIMGVPTEGPSYIYGDKMSMIYNTLRPVYVLRKKLNRICYHFVMEPVATKDFFTSHIPTLENLSNLLTKVMYGQKRHNLLKGVLCDIYDHDWDD